MSYVVIARRYRPQQFEEIVGQEHITRTLSNAIASGRIGQAYIFAGPRGVGKTTTARILAMALNCQSGPTATPDINCPICQAIIKGKSLDVMEIDGASNRRIEEVRNLRENINYTPSEGKYRIYIIDEVHMLTNEAFNALLKTLEEPPAHAVFIFATTEIHRVPATILSRCQRFDFKRIPLKIIMSQLRTICERENIQIEDDALIQIAKKADGSMRDSQSLLDQIISFGGTHITLEHIEQAIGSIDQEMFFKMGDLIHTRNLKDILLLTRDIFTSGMDLTELMLGLEEHYRNILVATAMNSVDMLDVSDNFAKRYKEQIGQYNENDLIAYLNIISQTVNELKWAQQPILKFELALVKMAKLPSSQNIEKILENLNLLKKKDLKTTNSSTTTQPASIGNPQQQTLDLQYIQNIFPKFKSEVTQAKPTFAPLLENATPVAFENMRLTIVFEIEEFNRMRVERNQSFIAQKISEILKQETKVNIQYKLIEPQANGSPMANSEKEDITQKIEELRSKDPLFNKFVVELGLEPD